VNIGGTYAPGWSNLDTWGSVAAAFETSSTAPIQEAHVVGGHGHAAVRPDAWEHHGAGGRDATRRRRPAGRSHRAAGGLDRDRLRARRRRWRVRPRALRRRGGYRRLPERGRRHVPWGIVGLSKEVVVSVSEWARLSTITDPPLDGQTHTEQMTGDGSTTAFQTNYPYAPNSVVGHVTVNGTLWPVTETTPTTGTFTFASAPPAAAVIVVTYQNAGTTGTGATNPIPPGIDARGGRARERGLPGRDGAGRALRGDRRRDDARRRARRHLGQPDRRRHALRLVACQRRVDRCGGPRGARGGHDGHPRHREHREPVRRWRH
jgi:hypothetical protein